MAIAVAHSDTACGKAALSSGSQGICGTRMTVMSTDTLLTGSHTERS